VDISGERLNESGNGTYNNVPPRDTIEWLWEPFLKADCKKVLDFGCGGVGWFGKYSPEKVTVYGCDKDKEAVERASSFERTKRAEIPREKPYPDNFFDGVLAFHVLEHIEEDGEAVKVLSEITKEGGVVVASSPSKHGDWKEDPGHLRGYGMKDFCSIFEDNGFKIVDCKNLGSGIPLFGKLGLINQARSITSFMARFLDYFKSNVFLIGRRERQ